MKELLDDVQTLLESNPGGVLDPVMKNGRVTQIATIEELPKQQSMPAIGLIDGGETITHLSSAVRDITMTVTVAVFVAIFDQYKKVPGRLPSSLAENKAAAEILRIVRGVLDMDRIGGKYAHAFLVSGEAVRLVHAAERNEHFLVRTQAYSYRRFVA